MKLNWSVNRARVRYRQLPSDVQFAVEAFGYLAGLLVAHSIWKDEYDEVFGFSKLGKKEASVEKDGPVAVDK